MRTLFFIVIFFSQASAYSQDSLTTIISKDVCNCLNNTKRITEQYYSNCFQASLRNNQKIVIENNLRVYGDTSHTTANRFADDITREVSVYLIQSCDNFFIFNDTLRYSDFANDNKDVINKDIRDINDRNPTNRDLGFYINRGVMYFHLKYLDSALQDFRSALAIDNRSIRTAYFLAWTYELKGNYNAAYSIYKQLASVTNDLKYYIYEALAKRKKNGL